MSSSKTLTDGLVFYDEDGSKVIFNHYSFCEILKWTMVKYAEIDYEKASYIVNNSGLIEPVMDYNDVTLISHEYEYHWAMLLVYGEQYWNKGLAPYPPDDSHFDWMDNLLLEKGLNNSYEYIDVRK